jgi:outer membrane protein assembly factor BamB
MNSILKIAVAAAACASLSACATVNKLNFLKSHKNTVIATAGKRIPVLSYDQKIEASTTLAGVVFQIPEAHPVTAWPLPGGTAEQSMENVAAAPDLRVLWKHTVGAGSGRRTEVTAPPVAVDGRIYTMDGAATVVATDDKTGARVWRADLAPKKGKDREAFGGGLAVAEGRVYVTSGYRFVVALDSATGKELWRKAVSSPIHGAPTVSAGRVFAVDVDNQIAAWDAATGDVAWTYQAIVEPARILRASSPAISGEAVVTPFSSGELVALRAANGNPLWNEVLSHTSRTSALSEIRDIAGRPVIYRGDVYAASHSGVFEAVDLRTGEKRWDLPVASVNSPWAAGDVVYVTDKAGEVLAVNRDTGQIYWIADLNKGKTHTRMEGGFAHIGRHVAHPVWTGPLLASGRLILVNNWGEMVALDGVTGKQVKSLKLGEAGFLTPIAVDGKIFIVTDKADLIAIG